MIADIVVLASVALTGVFVAAWLVSPPLRAWIERPKYRFQDALRQYDVAQDMDVESKPLAGQERFRP
jgi:hypothetical protein